MASFALPAWAVNAAHLFSEYSPASWVVAGFLGMLLASISYAIWQWAFRTRVRARYDYRLLSGPSPINPLDRTFEGKRIFLNEFVLPSHTVIESKTFIDCEIIGPANLYWYFNNQASDIWGPKMDAVFLDPGVKFNNGISLRNCIFRGCSFHHVTVFVGKHDYETIKRTEVLNWISYTPDSQIQESLVLNNPPSPETDSQLPEGSELKILPKIHPG